MTPTVEKMRGIDNFKDYFRFCQENAIWDSKIWRNEGMIGYDGSKKMVRDFQTWIEKHYLSECTVVEALYASIEHCKRFPAAAFRQVLEFVETAKAPFFWKAFEFTCVLAHYVRLVGTDVNLQPKECVTVSWTTLEYLKNLKFQERPYPKTFQLSTGGTPVILIGNDTITTVVEGTVIVNNCPPDKAELIGENLPKLLALYENPELEYVTCSATGELGLTETLRGVVSSNSRNSGLHLVLPFFRHQPFGQKLKNGKWNPLNRRWQIVPAFHRKAVA